MAQFEVIAKLKEESQLNDIEVAAKSKKMTELDDGISDAITRNCTVSKIKLQQKETMSKLEKQVAQKSITAEKGKGKQSELFITNDREYQIYRNNDLKLQELRVKSHEMDKGILQIKYQIGQLQK